LEMEWRSIWIRILMVKVFPVPGGPYISRISWVLILDTLSNAAFWELLSIDEVLARKDCI